MEEKQEKEKGNFWLTVASFIVNKRKAIEILFVLAMIYSVLSINKVQVISLYTMRIKALFSHSTVKFITTRI